MNDVPVAVDDAYAVKEDTTLKIPASGILGNDTDADGDVLKALLISGPSHGSLQLKSDGSFTYTPDKNYFGRDTFTYKANDGTADSNIATVTITIRNVPDLPPPVVFTGIQLGIIPVTGEQGMIVAGLEHTCAIGQNGGVKCWGLNDAGQLGDGTYKKHLTPVGVNGLNANVQLLAAGTKHTCALTSDGEVYCWGLNSSGQLGDGTTSNENKPVKVENLDRKIVSITAGAEFTCAVDTADVVKCWGNNTYGQLNDGTTTHSNVPVEAKMASDIMVISGGSKEMQGVTKDGSVQLWNSEPIIPVTGLPETDNMFVSADRFSEGGCALNTEGEVNCWGSIPNAEVKDVVPSNLVAAGNEHACAFTSKGLVCWGKNSHGQLGDGSTTDKEAPIRVKEMPENILSLAAGEQHTCAMLDDNSIMCWGMNNSGQLGIGSTQDSNVPVEVK